MRSFRMSMKIQITKKYLEHIIIFIVIYLYGYIYIYYSKTVKIQKSS